MPYLNGFNATKQIRKFNSTVPIIAQTAYSTIEEREEARNVGCNDFISKPIEKEVLIDAVNKTLGISNCSKYIYIYNLKSIGRLLHKL